MKNNEEYKLLESKVSLLASNKSHYDEKNEKNEKISSTNENYYLHTKLKYYLKHY